MAKNGPIFFREERVNNLSERLQPGSADLADSTELLARMTSFSLGRAARIATLPSELTVTVNVLVKKWWV